MTDLDQKLARARELESELDRIELERRRVVEELVRLLSEATEPN